MVPHNELHLRAAALGVKPPLLDDLLKYVFDGLSHQPLQLPAVDSALRPAQVGHGLQRHDEHAAQARLAALLGLGLQQDPLALLLQNPPEHFRDIGKVVVKGLPGDVALLHDVLHRQLFHMLFQQQRHGRLGDDPFHVHGHSVPPPLQNVLLEYYTWAGQVWQ